MNKWPTQISKEIIPTILIGRIFKKTFKPFLEAKFAHSVVALRLSVKNTTNNLHRLH